MKTIPLDIPMLKIWLQEAWRRGDYAHFYPYMEPGAREFLLRLDIAPGAKLLDVGCGGGHLALLAAQAGAQVTGIDIFPNLLDMARKRARAQGVSIQFDQGDVETLPYENAHFDVVLSLFSTMFAPRPERTTAEMLRITKPGGRIIMANWTPDGFVGRMAKVITRHYAPPPIMTSPWQWGDEAQVCARLQHGVRELQMTHQLYPLHFPFPPVEVVEFLRKYYGPLNRTFEELDRIGCAALKTDLEQFWIENNRSEKPDATHIEAAYLEVDAVKD